MNKLKKIIIASLGGLDVLFTLVTPMLIYFMWTILFGSKTFGSYLILFVALCSSIFRAIKIGWITK